MDVRGCGPLIWWFGISILLCGDRALHDIASRLAHSPSYETVQNYRRKLYWDNKKKPVEEKLKDSSLFHPAWDNIDSRKVSNNPHALGDSPDFHGTILTALWNISTKPIITQESHSVLSSSEFPITSSMLCHSRVSDGNTIKSAQALICELC